MGRNDKTFAAVIVAAGRGQRMRGDGPKQYQRLGDKSVLASSVQPFLDHPHISHVQVVIHGDDRALYDEAVSHHEKMRQPVKGGATRQQSVKAGLDALGDVHPSHVLVHDAARPFVDKTVLENVMDGLNNADAVLPCVPVVDTIKRVDTDNIVQRTEDRNTLAAAQTPQGFRYQTLVQLHRESQDEATDDAALAEAAGLKVLVVDGHPNNVKLTTRSDMENARMRLQPTIPDIRVGHGYDTHQIVPDRELWLCGVKLDHHSGLSGHSDADVGLHALTDALLATIAAGDIGSHFPPSDEKWRDARSDQFLRHAVSLLTNVGGTITHMDVTLLCEQPKIGPHRDAMRLEMARITGVDVSRISVKATTNERIGFIGREEGMVALATATVCMGVLS